MNRVWCTQKARKKSSLPGECLPSVVTPTGGLELRFAVSYPIPMGSLRFSGYTTPVHPIPLTNLITRVKLTLIFTADALR